MILKELELTQYRNYARLSFSPGEGINLLSGKNAQGKTNLLEAIFFCATGRSHRGAKDKELIRFGSEEAHIRLRTEKDEIPHSIDVHLKQTGRKGIAIDGSPIRRVVDLFGTLRAVFFAPEDLSIVKRGPQERRNFMDVELCQIDPVYTHDLIRYNKAVMQKNALLRQLKEDLSAEGTLSVWNDQLCLYGEPVIRARQRFLRELEPLVQAIHGEITGGKERLSLFYEPSRPAESLAATLVEKQAREKAAGMSLYGPHRDDIRIEVDGLDLRHYGSQGQQRTAALSMKLAEIDLIRERTGTAPVVLLDDVLSELDSGRQERLMASLSEVQTILTCTDAEAVLRQTGIRARRYLIENGNLREQAE